MCSPSGDDLRELRSRYERLTARERDLLALLVAGQPNKNTASELVIAERTVRAADGRQLPVREAAARRSSPDHAHAQPGDVTMTADRWEAVFGKPEFKEHKGAQAIVFAQEGGAALKGLTFRNGTVEFDVDPAAMGAGPARLLRQLRRPRVVGGTVGSASGSPDEVS